MRPSPPGSGGAPKAFPNAWQDGTSRASVGFRSVPHVSEPKHGEVRQTGHGEDLRSNASLGEVPNPRRIKRRANKPGHGEEIMRSLPNAGGGEAIEF